jgi:hypothetical protein
MMQSLFPRCLSQLMLIAPTQDAPSTFIVLEFVRPDKNEKAQSKTPN